MSALEEEEALGFTFWRLETVVLEFFGAAIDEVFGRPGFTLTRRRTVRRPVTRLETHVRSGELLATKRVMWSQGDV
jgi:hypothetical protein